MEVVMNGDEIQQLLNYMTKRPYGEVAGLIQMIHIAHKRTGDEAKAANKTKQDKELLEKEKKEKETIAKESQDGKRAKVKLAKDNPKGVEAAAQSH